MFQHVKNVVWAAVVFGTCLCGAEPAWPTVTNEMRPWCYNWWMGNAVDAAGLERQAKDFEASGFGGFHAIPIYEVKDARYKEVKYLSPEWTQLFNAGKESAKRHGLELDLSTGCGWCFGGPWLTPEQGIWRLQRESDTRRLKKGAKVLWSGKDAKGPLILAAYPSGMLVKRAPTTGRGPMMDPFSPEVMRTHLAPFTTAFDRPGAAKPRCMYHDSYEYYGAAWTPNFFEAFRTKRGYDLRDHLAAFAGVGDADEIRRVKHDYRETLSDLILDTFTVWTDWCRVRRIKTRNEAHGAPANWLDFYALADIPETEMFNTDRDILVSKFASSVAHLKGTSQVASESCTWINEHFNATLDEVQVFLNQLLLSGVNHIFYHGCCYSPVEAAWPGWCFYASLEMNPRNPIWRDAKVLNAWLTRVQSLAQTSMPDEDVLVYWPIHDFWSTPDGYVREMSVHNKWFAGLPFGILSRRLYDAGVSFDYVSDRLLTTLPPAAKSHWKTIVIPACETMPLATARTLARLAKDGYRIVFDGTRPTDVPGLKTDAATRKSLAEALAAIPGTVPVSKGSVPTQTPAAEGSVPVSKGSVPAKVVGGCADVAQVGRCEPFTKASGLAYQRFRRGADTLYFVVNNSQRHVAGCYVPTVSFTKAWTLDPMTGDIKPLPTKGGLSLSLPAGESIWFWLSNEGGQTPVDKRGQTLADERGQTPSRKRVVELSGPWTLTPVCGGPLAASSAAAPGGQTPLAAGGQTPWLRTMAKLTSWSRNEDGTENPFSGTVCYRTTFKWEPPKGIYPGRATTVSSKGVVSKPLKVPPPEERMTGPFELDLGEVCHSARVRMNGQDLGARVRKPYKFAIPAKVLKIGENVLEVEVTSTAANRIRDLDRRKVEWKIFGDINIVGRNYKPFDAAQWPLVDAGLLGPVRIWEKIPLP